MVVQMEDLPTMRFIILGHATKDTEAGVLGLVALKRGEALGTPPGQYLLQAGIAACAWTVQPAASHTQVAPMLRSCTRR